MTVINVKELLLRSKFDLHLLSYEILTPGQLAVVNNELPVGPYLAAVFMASVEEGEISFTVNKHNHYCSYVVHILSAYKRDFHVQSIVLQSTSANWAVFILCMIRNVKLPLFLECEINKWLKRS